eukprot:CAMPEP_0173450684 /NCGR_PEP_ID=MMETSP1357-20121228/45269_1 /TAXON_ID=77926 /ORGANISM="Hemiselmis rufescens, Strain PCC563" /LENGTH=165 /DNA_ID=CAMNT_0014417389 /DNA_START=152 /DNA_END=646 /DNA_ORIENTATION=-
MSEIEWRMIQWCEKRKPFQNSMVASKQALFKLRKEVRNAVKTLTIAEEATIESDGIVGGHDLQVVLTLEDFDHECYDIFESLTTLVKRVIDAVPPSEGSPPISDCIVVGGAMRVRAAQRLLSGMLEPLGVRVRKTLDMDRAVSMGAAMYGALRANCATSLPLENQ